MSAWARFVAHARENQKCIDAVTVPAGALIAAVLWWHYTREPTEPAPEPVCSSVPYELGERPDCLVIEDR